MVFNLIGIENILINEMIENYEIFEDHTLLLIKNLISSEKFYFKNDDLNSYLWKDSFLMCFFNRIFNIIKIILALLMISNVTSIYIKITVICAPIFLTLISKKKIKKNKLKNKIL